MCFYGARGCVWSVATSSCSGVDWVKQQAALACLLLARASVGWAVCEMTEHANKLHHFCLCGRGQWATICRSGEMNGAHLCWHPEPPLPPTLLGPPWHRGRHRQTSPPSATPPCCCPPQDPISQLQQIYYWISYLAYGNLYIKKEKSVLHSVELRQHFSNKILNTL